MHLVDRSSITRLLCTSGIVARSGESKTGGDLPSSEWDQNFGSVLFGWGIGFAIMVIITAVRQTKTITLYSVLCWIEIVASLTLGTIVWLSLMGFIVAGLPAWITTLLFWAIQLHCLTQILVNRICLLVYNPRNKVRLKVGTAVVILVVNIMVTITWLPIMLNGSGLWKNAVRVLYFLDPAEKCVVLLLDAALNFLFMKVVKDRLVNIGLRRYQKIINFNRRIVFLSLSMDVLLTGLIWYHERRIYQLFHPIAYLVKLRIEMVMSDVIIRVARDTGADARLNETAQSPQETGASLQQNKSEDKSYQPETLEQSLATFGDQVGSKGSPDPCTIPLTPTLPEDVSKSLSQTRSDQPSEFFTVTNPCQVDVV